MIILPSLKRQQYLQYGHVALSALKQSSVQCLKNSEFKYENKIKIKINMINKKMKNKENKNKRKRLRLSYIQRCKKVHEKSTHEEYK